MLNNFYILFLFFSFLLLSCAAIDKTPKPTEYFGVPKILLNEFDYKEVKKKEESSSIKKSEENKKSKAKNKSKNKLKNKKKALSLLFIPGERTILSITYLGVEAATIDIEVLPLKRKREKWLYHVQGLLQSSPFFSVFYRVHDKAESFFDFEKLYSHKFSLQLDEARKKRDLLELYDEDSLELYYWDRMRHKRKGFHLVQFIKKLNKHSQDALSALFYLRTLELKEGKSYSFPVVSNGKPWTIHAKVEEKAPLATSLGNFPAIKISLESRFEGILKKRGEIFVWLSDDKNRFLLKVDATVKIGRVIAYLKRLKRGEM